MSFSLLAAQESKLRIIQTNSAGDNIHIIDPVTNKVVGEIKGIEANHGIAVSRDGKRIYVSEEAQKTVTVFDGTTLEVIKRIPLSGNPNLIDTTPGGRWIYAAIAQTWDDLSEFPQIKAAASGGVDVIDTASLQNVKTIAIKGGIHDLNVTPDGKYVVAGASRGAKPPANMINVIDTKTNEIAWKLLMSPAPSPMAISKNPDGSTKLIFAQLGDFNGFAVADFATQTKIDQIKLPELPPRATEPFRAARRISRHCGNRGSKDAIGQQQAEQCPLRLLAAGPEALGRCRAEREGRRLVDDHARRQDGLRGQ
jgi:YVTN family beta-propeller protein